MTEPDLHRLVDFTFDDRSRLRFPPGEPFPAGYLDGAERELVEQLGRVEDRSIGSEELARLVHDWPTLYHLSPFRTTLFDCLEFTGEPARVLELGSGCGAITRWLGEHCAEVHAIEGNPARALATRTRCADLANVEVYVGNYSQLAERAAFDVVTLIGVLEYSHLYHPTERDDPATAALANLRQARSALRDDGVLVLAIENQLGVKYLNGAREDHSGRPYDGIEGYPDPSRSAATFSRRRLEEMLAAAGFGERAFLLPFPDYKLAATIVNPDRCDDDDRIYNWLDGPAPDRGAERQPMPFNELLAQRELARAGLLRDVANSFLVLAWPDGSARARNRAGLELGWKARRYSLDRRRDFRKVATLVGDSVEHAAVHEGPRDEAAVVERVLGFRQTLGSEPFRRGDLLLYDVLSTVAAHGFGPAFSAHVVELRAWLLEHFAAHSNVDSVPFVSGEAFDAVWWNVVVAPTTREWQLIDREWSVRDALPVDYVVWRTLFHFAFRYATVVRAEAFVGAPDAFADRWTAEAAPALPAWFPEVCRELDTSFGSAAVRGPLPAQPPVCRDALQELASPSCSTVTVLASAEEIIAEPNLLKAYGRHFGPADDATLLLEVKGDPHAIAPAVEAAMRAAGMGDGAPDLLLLPAAGDGGMRGGSPASILAVLSDRPQPPALQALPRYGEHQVAELRSLAERAWA